MKKNIYRDHKLGDLVSITTGKLDSNAAKVNGQYPFFTCSRETFRTDTYSFNCECVLLAGNNAAGIFPIKYFKGKFDVYQRTYVIQSIDEGYLINRFLFYLLLPKLEFLKSVSTGVATKFLTLTILKDLNLLIPSLDIQEKITTILSAYDDLIENNLRRIKILEEIAQTLYKEWFVKFRFPGHQKVKMVDSPLGKIPEGWEAKNLFELADVTYGFPFKSSMFNTNREGIPVVRIRDVLNGQSSTFTIENAPDKYTVHKGDFLVGMDGDFHMGFWAGGTAFLVQRVARFLPKGNIGRYLLALALKEPIEHFNKTITGTTVAHLGDNHLRTINMMMSDKKLLKVINDILEPLLDFQLNLRAKNKNLQQTRDFLIPKLISGEQ